MFKNLRNVAIPGTGIPLSIYCSFKAMVYFFILAVNPVLCFMAAINLQRTHGRYVEIQRGAACLLKKIKSLEVFLNCSGFWLMDTSPRVVPARMLFGTVSLLLLFFSPCMCKECAHLHRFHDGCHVNIYQWPTLVRQWLVFGCRDCARSLEPVLSPA